MSAVEKVKESVRLAGVRISPEDLPYEIVESDYSYDTTRHGTLARFILKVETIDTQTPRSEYVEIVAELTSEGLEAPEEWTVSAVEKKTVTKTEFVRKS